MFQAAITDACAQILRPTLFVHVTDIVAEECLQNNLNDGNLVTVPLVSLWTLANWRTYRFPVQELVLKFLRQCLNRLQ